MHGHKADQAASIPVLGGQHPTWDDLGSLGLLKSFSKASWKRPLGGPEGAQNLGKRSVWAPRQVQEGGSPPRTLPDGPREPKNIPVLGCWQPELG